MDQLPFFLKSALTDLSLTWEPVSVPFSGSCPRELHKWEGGQKAGRAVVGPIWEGWGRVSIFCPGHSGVHRKFFFSPHPAKWFLRLPKANPHILWESSLKMTQINAEKLMKGYFLRLTLHFGTCTLGAHTVVLSEGPEALQASPLSPFMTSFQPWLRVSHAFLSVATLRD